MRSVGVPTTWKEMRYAIVAALHSMGDDGPWWSAEIQFEIERLFNKDDTYVDWDDRGPWGKAWNRAFASLRSEGVVTYDDIDGIRLVMWDDE